MPKSRCARCLAWTLTLKLHGTRYRKPGLFFTPRAELALLDCPWLGNVRELRNVLEHAALMAQEDAIGESQLAKLTCPAGMHIEMKRPTLVTTGSMSASLADDGLNLEKIERECLLRALQNTAWNVTHAAKLLGLSRDTLRYRMEKHAIKTPQ